MTDKPNNLEALGEALEKAIIWYTELTKRYVPLGRYSVTEDLMLPPKPDAPDDYLDAWCDYLIARTRYERAMVRARRGVEL